MLRNQRRALYGVPSMAEIVLDRVTKTHPDGVAAVRDLSITIADGEFVVLVGPSGCGKSTTLNMIAGLDEITSGDLLIDGRRVNDLSPKDRDIAMVFQSYALYPHLTVRQNIAFPLTLTKLAREQISEKVEQTAKTLDLVDLLDRKPDQLSGGQRQRVAMGRAIVRSPKAFLMDEPLSNLDAKLRGQMRSEIARLQKRLGTTTVFVTHDQTEAMMLGDRLVVMSAGAVQQIGTPDELYRDPLNLFVAGFIGSPPMNFFPAAVTGLGVRLPFGEVPLTGESYERIRDHRSAKDLVAGVRPEHLQDADVIDAYARINALCFDVTVELVESLGADKYAYFTTDGPAVQAAQLTEAADSALESLASGSAGNEFVARVPAQSAARAGETMRLALDPTAVMVFDPRTGANLTRAAGPR